MTPRKIFQGNKLNIARNERIPRLLFKIAPLFFQLCPLQLGIYKAVGNRL